QGPGRSAFDVRPAVVFANPEGRADGCRDRVADAGRERDLLVVAYVHVAFDQGLTAEGPGVPRGTQEADRQHGRDERVVSILLQAGGEAPVLVPELGVGLKG